MSIGLVGRKVGMTRIFTDEGDALPVTVLDVSDNRITQIKTAEKDGYSAIQVTFGTRRASRVRKPLAGHLAKAAVEAGHTLKEFRAEAKDVANLKVGGKLGVELFKVGQAVDVQGTTIGKGFAGVVKRHHFAGNRATHGNSITTRTPGSTGQRQSPGRVFVGKKMAGQLGNVTRTVQNLIVVRIDADRQLLLVRGSVPGHAGRDIVVRPSVKPYKPPQIAKPTVRDAAGRKTSEKAKDAGKPEAAKAAPAAAKPAPAAAKPEAKA